jgi:site-specific DNA recombinase
MDIGSSGCTGVAKVQHEAIVERDLFDAVQATLDENRNGRRARRSQSDALLMSRIFDDRGNRMSPTYAIKKGARYRYYVSTMLVQGRKSEAGSVARVPASEIESLVMAAVRSSLDVMSETAMPSASTAISTAW